MEDMLSYYNYANGWTSRWSYVPEWMVHMNSNFYTFKRGNLYIHNLNPVRNNFYETQYTSTLSTIFNIEPTTIKKFKNLYLDSSHEWKATMHTNLDEGYIDYDWYEKKEGKWYAHIRRPSNNTDYSLLSTQGIGNVSQVISSTIFFGSPIQVNLNIGDTVCKIVGSSLVTIGTILSFSEYSIDLTGILVSPAPGDKIVIIKNAVAESFGPRGYYLQVDLENDKSYEVTLFAVGASLFKSFP
jgi:hypothetical protein